MEEDWHYKTIISNLTQQQTHRFFQNYLLFLLTTLLARHLGAEFDILISRKIYLYDYIAQCQK